jgi:RPA family protein
MIEIGISIVGVITEIEIIGEIWRIEIEDHLGMIGGTIEGVQVKEFTVTNEDSGTGLFSIKFSFKPLA